jgi:hypothetical protein
MDLLPPKTGGSSVRAPHLWLFAIGVPAAVLAGVAGACIENIPKPSGTVASITIVPESTAVMQGDTLTLVATARNASHVILTDVELGWASSDLNVATVTGAGLVRAVAPGAATIVATADAASGSARVSVVPRIVALRITPRGLTLVPGGQFAFVADGVDSSGTPIARRAPTWTSSDTTVVRIAADGAATALRVGSAWLLAHDGALADSVRVLATTVHFTAVSAGPYQNTCATGPQGAFCWGYDGNAGNLGIGVGVDAANTPIGVVGGDRFVAVTAGDAFTCGLTADGAPYCWGDGTYGRLGDGTTDISRATPAAVAGSLTLQNISTGRRHACGLTPAGQAWCWGGNSRGALGVPLATAQSAVPVPVATEQLFTAVRAGYVHTCGLAPDSVIWCWGRGTELGDSVAVTRTQPAPVYGGHRFRSLSVGWTHSCGVATDDQIYCWGYNLAGEIGRQADSLVKMPVTVDGGPALVSVTAGYYATCGLTADARAYCWGLNNTGQLGTGDAVGGPLPRAVAGGLLFTSLSIGYGHTCGIATDGLLYCWGGGLHGMLGDGTDSGERLTPHPVSGQLVSPGVAARHR